ncbi:hypothetical protein QFZ37_003151 [Chryseobacterium ginsenosidimutans]|uniref:hypothetical protein n=1 Tax=Chryseobacterium ginsenosidimutans TaxID=687846 RepID=UPI0027859763|nr:hypothetical protein [Chryseobacterium ginsenosidimutans]MDQ0594782.1 hypothetical protein [Chryseobacterium ginsenosidimutans]
MLNKNYILILMLSSACLFGQSKFFDIVNSVKKEMNSKSYSLQLEKKCDINKDGLTDEILLFNKDAHFSNEDDIETLDSPIYVILSTNKIFENDKIIYTFIPNNSNLDNNIVTKSNYFTIEQTTGNGENKKTTYITFKFLNNKLFLHKYGSDTNYPKNDKLIKTTKIYNQKDFGNISFENFDIESINSSIK